MSGERWSIVMVVCICRYKDIEPSAFKHEPERTKIDSVNNLLEDSSVRKSRRLELVRRMGWVGAGMDRDG
jgi:hypothetical protein